MNFGGRPENVETRMLQFHPYYFDPRKQGLENFNEENSVDPKQCRYFCDGGALRGTQLSSYYHGAQTILPRARRHEHRRRGQSRRRVLTISQTDEDAQRVKVPPKECPGKPCEVSWSLGGMSPRCLYDSSS